MIAGLTGSLLSHDALSELVFDHDGGIAGAERALQAWHGRISKEMGPANAPRLVFDRLAAPLLQQLGFRVVPIGGRADTCLYAQLEVDGRTAAVVVVTAWGQDPSSAWSDAVRLGIGHTVRWGVCITGPLLRIVDAARTYSRRYAQFDLEVTMSDAAAFATLWSLLHAGGFTGSSQSTLHRAVIASEQFRAEVRASLQEGVLDALRSLLAAFAAARRRRRRTADSGALMDESLVVIYRILFLLFAEARGLVPKWHPVFRDSYTIECLRDSIERHARPSGLWESLQAIARLAHDGCHAGTLVVAPFNGRLFSPAHAPLAESLALDDAAVREAMLALTTRSSTHGRRRIAYTDLGVEQLGGVYERVLDFSPSAVTGDRRALTLLPAVRRKATGTFYTPRSLTEFLVRRTLAPLVADAGPERILSLRIVDPAMGSGAFLVAACRYLAAAYESAVVREGAVAAFDVTEADRARFRRTIAQRCLFGVDVNPMAVQLGRLSLWLTTLAGDRPLTFLDHHLRDGNSLVGASPEDVARQPPLRGGRRRAAAPLFELASLDADIGSAVVPRMSLARDPGDTIEQVRAKEQLLRSLQQDEAPLARWKTVSDLWCAEWFRGGRHVTAAMFGTLVDFVIGRGSALPVQTCRPLLEESRSIAERMRFFHWPLEFPEVFYERDGTPRASPGFDAVIGNPPWEMLRGDRGAFDDAASLTAFSRESGIYRLHGEGHANLYQLFTERALALVRKGGRVGLVLPSGFAIDHGCRSLRRALLDTTAVDTFVTVENRDGVFPIHRGLKFVLVTGAAGTATTAIPSHAGVRSPDVLDRLPDSGNPAAIVIPRSVVEQFSGEQHAIPELRTSQDLAIVSRIAFSIPPLIGPGGWNVAFGRELNATDDRGHFVPTPASPRDCLIVEGKQIAPFRIELGMARYAIPAREASRLLGTSFTRARLAYRDVASASNRLTLIAAILPPNVVSTHTLFCAKGDVDPDVQQFLCGIFNSFVANYLVRLRVSTHVTVAIVERLFVPHPSLDSIEFATVVELTRILTKNPHDAAAAARLQGVAAALYGCTDLEYRHILESFPLVPVVDRAAALAQLAGIRRCIRSGEP
jgi:hypothetical protein